MPPRILTAGLFHETHTFLEGVTPWEDFDVFLDDEIFRCRGDASPMGGFLEFAEQQNWEVVPTIQAIGIPSATVADDVYHRFWEAFAARAKPAIEQGIDAIYLVLHGAFARQSSTDVEGDLLRQIRELPGCQQLPLFGVYDLHANFSPQMAQFADGLVAYRENPHTDARMAAVRAAECLARCLQQGSRPTQIYAPVPLIWPPTGVGSADDPMKTLLAMARQLEADHPELWAVNVNAGYCFTDSAHTSVSFSAITSDTAENGKALLQPLCDRAMSMAQQGYVTDPPVDDVLTELKAQADADQLTGLTVLIEPSENIGGGSAGDGPTLLRKLIEYQFPNAAICLCDPAAVAQLEATPVGESATLQLGGHRSRYTEGPVELNCKLVRIDDGRFELEDKHSHLASAVGDFFDMGRTAVVEHGDVTILLTSNSTPPMDLGQWRHMGLNPEDFSFIVVKAAVSHRQAYDPIAARQLRVDTPGPCSSTLTRFDYQHVQRPVFPLDSLAMLDR